MSQEKRLREMDIEAARKSRGDCKVGESVMGMAADEIRGLRDALLKLSDPVGHATPRERDAWIRRTTLAALNTP